MKWLKLFATSSSVGGLAGGGYFLYTWWFSGTPDSIGAGIISAVNASVSLATLAVFKIKNDIEVRKHELYLKEIMHQEEKRREELLREEIKLKNTLSEVRMAQNKLELLKANKGISSKDLRIISSSSISELDDTSTTPDILYVSSASSMFPRLKRHTEETATKEQQLNEIQTRRDAALIQLREDIIKFRAISVRQVNNN